MEKIKEICKTIFTTKYWRDFFGMDVEGCGFSSELHQFTKVPQVTSVFWAIKICCTTVGESLSDCFNLKLGWGLGYTALFFYPIWVVILLKNFHLSCYVPFWYWAGVVSTSIVGTIATDGFRVDVYCQSCGRAHHVYLWLEALIAFICMVAVFYAWYRSEGTVDIHSIYTQRREMFYWLAIWFTFALGTAVGDFCSSHAGIGFGPIFGAFLAWQILLIPVWYFKILSEVTIFWIAYIFTRPLGATLGDLMASPQPQAAGIGLTGTCLLFLGIIWFGIMYLTYTKCDQIPIEEALEHEKKMKEKFGDNKVENRKGGLEMTVKAEEGVVNQ